LWANSNTNGHADCKPISDAHSYVYAYPDSPGYGYTYSASYGYTYSNRDASRLQYLHNGYGDRHDHAWRHRYRQPLRRLQYYYFLPIRGQRLRADL
jgi:hypothetical protein